MSKQPNPHDYGKAWWDFGGADGLRVGVEVEHAPTDKHFLCFIPYTGKDAGEAIKVAEYLVSLLNAHKRP